MRLTKIKLAGFKSFVDPTTLHLPGNLVAVVGPNGCGKSNVIDAVRWVMGESSARTLRGESMADVIFNGSATRKPVGQAAVELTFDNSQGRLGGPWSRYSEIAIRRLVSRDGQSQYFLNGSRCRRRDITDIFLGTGLGPRSYAIIEQGTISRVIEARPEELRTFLEEAAGISKYKERRRETESRIQHTRENLSRLNDVREELARQLQHLERQARAAEQYQRYRAEERRLKGELLALRWQALDRERGVLEQALREQETALEAVVAEQRSLEARLAAGREHQSALTEALSQAQAQFYRIGSEISRLEQHLEHRRELHRRQSEELTRSQQALTDVLAQQDADRTRLAELEQALSAAEPALARVQAEETQAHARLLAAEAELHEWQTAWEAFSQRATEGQRRAAVERTRIEHLERQLLHQERRLERLRLEQDNQAGAELAAELEELRAAEPAAVEDLRSAQEELVRVGAKIIELREAQRPLTGAIDALRERIQAGRGRLSSLETLQEAALGKQQHRVGHWLKGQRLEQAPCLAERLTVEPGWEQAAETVLGGYLEAVCVQDLNAPAAALTELEQGSLTLLDSNGDGHEPPPGQDGYLLNRVRAPWPLTSLLAGVRVAASLDEALVRRHELEGRDSLITPDGAWLGRNWLRVARGADHGVLVREREIQALKAALDQDSATLAQQTEALERVRRQLHSSEESRAALQDEIHQSQREHARRQEKINALQARFEQSRARAAALAEEQAELAYQVEQEQEALQQARLDLEDALQTLEQLQDERRRLAERRDGLQSAGQERRAAAAESRQNAQRQVLAVAELRTRLASTGQALERLERQQQQLRQRCAQLAVGPDSDDPLLETVRAQLQALLQDRLNAERSLSAARDRAQAQASELQALEHARAACERRAQTLRQTVEAQRLSLGESQVRRQTLLEPLQELGLGLDEIVAQLPNEAAVDAWQAKLEKAAARIQRLGPINLTAIEEYAQLAERKQHLDAQNADLTEALATLENAIRKIDRDTRSRFQDTFERVNAGLEGLFPRLFGGGQAHLEMTAEDWLEAGVTILARPPGKRIGNIHLLSGGEKALTAVALVFAIFQLNPAPFCLLDEVDAPLDEANIARFGALLREMSERVQFIFITHNKGTMEIAGHLAGVTMQEPGVSRLVAVDVAEAVRLAAV